MIYELSDRLSKVVIVLLNHRRIRMWKIIKEIAGVLVTIVIIINVVKYYWEFYNPTCTNKDTTTNIVEVLN